MPLLALLALLPSFGFSTPIDKVNAPSLIPRDPSTATCAGGPSPIDSSAASNYAVTMSQTDPGICQGFLDNLHGGCGLGITSYSCNAAPSGQMNVTFVAPTTCQGSSISNAITAASKPNVKNAPCSFAEPDGPGAGEGLATALDAVFHGAAEAFADLK